MYLLVRTLNTGMGRGGRKLSKGQLDFDRQRSREISSGLPNQARAPQWEWGMGSSSVPDGPAR